MFRFKEYNGMEFCGSAHVNRDSTQDSTNLLSKANCCCGRVHVKQIDKNINLFFFFLINVMILDPHTPSFLPFCPVLFTAPPPFLHTLPSDCQDKRCCSCTPARCWFFDSCVPLSLWCHIRLHCNYQRTGSVRSAEHGQSYLERTVSRSEFTWL